MLQGESWRARSGQGSSTLVTSSRSHRTSATAMLAVLLLSDRLLFSVVARKPKSHFVSRLRASCKNCDPVKLNPREEDVFLRESQLILMDVTGSDDEAREQRMQAKLATLKYSGLLIDFLTSSCLPISRVAFSSIFSLNLSNALYFPNENVNIFYKNYKTMNPNHRHQTSLTTTTQLPRNEIYQSPPRTKLLKSELFLEEN